MKLLNSLKVSLSVTLILAVIIPVFFLIVPVTGLTLDVNAASVNLPVGAFSTSSATAKSTRATQVSVEGLFAYSIVQQPTKNPGFVSSEKNKITQFSLATRYGSTGLLAHNYLVGAEFFGIEVGDTITVTYGDGKTKTFVVQELRRYQALKPTSPYSDFIDLDNKKVRLTATQLFNRVYAVKDRLILQTCIEANGNSSWGRLFVIATPVTKTAMR